LIDMPRRSFQSLIARGSSLGTWSQIASAEVIDMLGAAGFDFTIIDCEHGAFGIETAEMLIRACDANGIVPVVRAPSPDPAFVGKALDASAAAVLMPQVASADQAHAAVAAGRFAPAGTRGACPCVRAGGHFITDWRAYVGAQTRETGVMALVETAEGLANIEAICAVEGLLALVLGPFDLSVSLGFEGDYRRDEVQAALQRMLTAAKANNLPVIAPIFNPDAAEAKRQQDGWRALGASHFVIGTDKIIFADAAARYRRQLA
jgi:4-hydroxy-2-oxoheptanedioate aldolase